MEQTTSSIHMDENLKRQLERLCDELGMSVSTAVTIFAKTAVRERRIPFDLRISPPKAPKSIEDMTQEEFDAKIQAGLDDIAAGRARPAKDVFLDFERKYEP